MPIGVESVQPFRLAIKGGIINSPKSQSTVIKLPSTLTYISESSVLLGIHLQQSNHW